MTREQMIDKILVCRLLEMLLDAGRNFDGDSFDICFTEQGYEEFDELFHELAERVDLYTSPHRDADN